ncbi:MAG: tetratricopeptide repeat protein [Candidatus Poribacteria bacterium]|nr:tetratricopeptide repeat protein [Candidatus Poribacteria bacterium]
MKQNSKFLWISLVLTVLLSCTQNLEQITEKVRNATVRIENTTGSRGSGFFVAADKIVTNIHVVDEAETVLVYGNFGKEVYLSIVEKVIASDPKNDLVILQVASPLNGTPLSIGNSRIGEPIFVAGYKDGKYKVTGGIVYGINDKRIRHDAKTSPGRSGGPVLNIKGEVIGITVTVSGNGANAAPSNAIPSNILKALMSKSKSGQGQSLDEWQKEDFVRAYGEYSSGTDKVVNSKYDEAIEDYTKAVKLFPDFADAYRNRGVTRYWLGNSCRKNGDVKKARSLYGEAINDLTKNLDDAYDYYQLANVKSDLGHLEVKDGNVDKAIKHYRDAIINYGASIEMQNPDFPIVLESAYFWRAVANLRLSHLKGQSGDSNKTWDEGVEDLTQAVKLGIRHADIFKPDSNSADDHYIRGLMELLLGQFNANSRNRSMVDKHYQEVFKYYDEATKLNPNDADFYYDSAINMLNPNDVNTYQIRAYTYQIRGMLKFLRGKSVANPGDIVKVRLHYQEAIEDYQEAIEDYQEAIKRYRKAVEDNSSYIVSANGNMAYTYSNMAYTKVLLGKYFESEGEKRSLEQAQSLYKEAIDDSTKAIDMDQNNASAYNARGAAKAAIEDYDGAISDLSKAIELNPKFAEVYRERGRVWEKIGQQKKAEADFKKAKELDPDIETK